MRINVLASIAAIILAVTGTVYAEEKADENKSKRMTLNRILK